MAEIKCEICTDKDSVECFCECHDEMHCAVCIAKAHGLFTADAVEAARREVWNKAIEVAANVIRLGGETETAGAVGVCAALEMEAAALTTAREEVRDGDV
jgi:hypothetical protein